MKSIKSTIFILVIFLAFSCQNTAQNKNPLSQVQTADPIVVAMENGKAKAYFASGCFWCVEAIYESVKGVEEVINGYAGGFTKNPTYEASNTGRTGHAEAVEVIYDPTIIDFATLVDIYFGSQNVTQVNGQGPDRGSQYRSIIFYQTQEQKDIIVQKKEDLAKALNKAIAAEIYPFQKFWIGEDYHQNYEKLHPNNRYIQGVSIPRLRKFQSKFPHLIKDSH